MYVAIGFNWLLQGINGMLLIKLECSQAVSLAYAMSVMKEKSIISTHTGINLVYVCNYKNG